jgi:predicted type IV restriction endonuclease
MGIIMTEKNSTERKKIMADFAVIVNNTVVNMIVAESKEIAEQVTFQTCIETPPEMGVKIGMRWNGSSFIDLDAPEPPPVEE